MVRADELRPWVMSTSLRTAAISAPASPLGSPETNPESVLAIHLATPGLAPAPAPRAAEEEAYAAAVSAWTAEEGGYAHEQATKPTTLGATLRQPRRTGRLDCREDRRMEQHALRRQSRV